MSFSRVIFSPNVALTISCQNKERGALQRKTLNKSVFVNLGMCGKYFVKLLEDINLIVNIS